ncbi:MAG TPA: tyrosine-type recombinase/integrase [Actinomycetota bacterium]|nr:tyrosine-type recombinase/integrase [Actinomycetota bacterium]
MVFCNDVGRPLESGQVSWGFHAALTRAGLPRIRLHDLRHTAASLLLAKCVRPKVVQKMLGHPTITLTLDNYSHLNPGL